MGDVHVYRVAVPRAYFSRDIPVIFSDYGRGDLDCTGYYDVVRVKAFSREDAAKRAWDLYGKVWLGRMKPKQASVRKISVFVNDPMSKTTTGRLTPIQVYED